MVAEQMLRESAEHEAADDLRDHDEEASRVGTLFSTETWVTLV